MRTEFRRQNSAPDTSSFHLIDETMLRPTFGLGLMGGGSWGAFASGVLEEIIPVLETIGEIRSISATSAGSVNGTAITAGLNKGGAHEAIRLKNRVWDQVKDSGVITDMFHNPFVDWLYPKDTRWPNLPSHFNMISGLQSILPSLTTQYISALVRDTIPDWKSVQTGRVKLFANTVQQHILTGKQQHIILTGKDLTPDGIAASAALKELGLHQIRDRNNPDDINYRYLDGGYAENPPLQPLLDSEVTDIVMIILHDHQQANTKHRHGAKLYHEEIHTDVASLALSDSNRVRIHAIEIEMSEGQINGWNLNDSSKLNTSPQFIDALFEAGRKAGIKWLKENGHNLGIESTYRPHATAVEKLIASGYNY